MSCRAFVPYPALILHGLTVAEKQQSAVQSRIELVGPVKNLICSLLSESVRGLAESWQLAGSLGGAAAR